MGLISEKTKALYAELNERAGAATNSYSATGYFLHTMYLFCACSQESPEGPIKVFS